MSTPQITSEGAQPARGRGRGGGRGKGGGRGNNSSIARKEVAAIAAISKIGPTRVLDASWVEDAALKGKSFVAWVGGGNSAPQQVTFHRPIGATPLSDRQWVATPTGEVGLLLERRSSEELARFERARASAMRAQVVAAGIGRCSRLVEGSPREFWTHAGSAECGPAVQVAMAAAKAAGKAESTWIDYVSETVKADESAFKAACTAPERRAAYEAGHPAPAYVTMGGPLGDRPQVAVEYLNELSLAAARDKVTKAVFGLLSLKEVVREVLVERVPQDQEE